MSPVAEAHIITGPNLAAIPKPLPAGIRGYAWSFVGGSGVRYFIVSREGMKVRDTVDSQEAAIFTCEDEAAAFHFAVNGLICAPLEMVAVEELACSHAWVIGSEGSATCAECGLFDPQDGHELQGGAAV